MIREIVGSNLTVPMEQIFMEQISIPELDFFHLVFEGCTLPYMLILCYMSRNINVAFLKKDHCMITPV